MHFSFHSSLSLPHPLHSCTFSIYSIFLLPLAGDRELVEFLQEEIVAEKKSVQPNLPSHLGDFTVKASQAELTLSRTFHDEKWVLELILSVYPPVQCVCVCAQTLSQDLLKARPGYCAQLACMCVLVINFHPVQFQVCLCIHSSFISFTLCL